MGLLSKLTKIGLAKKAIDEGRKPQNQRRIKALFSKGQQTQPSRGRRRVR